VAAIEEDSQEDRPEVDLDRTTELVLTRATAMEAATMADKVVEAVVATTTTTTETMDESSLVKITNRIMVTKTKKVHTEVATTTEEVTEEVTEEELEVAAATTKAMEEQVATAFLPNHAHLLFLFLKIQKMQRFKNAASSPTSSK